MKTTRHHSYIFIVCFLFWISQISCAQLITPKIDAMPTEQGWQVLNPPFVSPSGNILSGKLVNLETKNAVPFVWKRGESSLQKYYYKVEGCNSDEFVSGPVSEDGRLFILRDCKWRLAIFFNGKFQRFLGGNTTPSYPVWSVGQIAPTGYFACGLAGPDSHNGKAAIIQMNLDNNRFKFEGINVIGNNQGSGWPDFPCLTFSPDGNSMVYLERSGRILYWGRYADDWSLTFNNDVAETYTVSYNQNFFLVSRKLPELSSTIKGILSRDGRWVPLEPLPVDWDKRALILSSVSHDGKTVVGWLAGRGVIWREGAGWQLLDDFIQNTLKLDLAGKYTRWAIASADASKITALVSDKNFQKRQVIVISFD